MNSPVYRSSRSALARSGAVLAEAVFETKVAGLTLESQLLLQASLDGELDSLDGLGEDLESSHERKAQSLLRQLRLVKSIMFRGELERPVPQSRECYWHTIQRVISSDPPNSGVRAPGNFPETERRMKEIPRHVTPDGPRRLSLEKKLVMMVRRYRAAEKRRLQKNLPPRNRSGI